MQGIDVLKERTVQDYRSAYNDIRDWFRRERNGKAPEDSKIDWDDVVFEIDLLKSQEIDLDYILELIFEHNRKTKDKPALVDEVRRVIRASIGNRAKRVSLLILSMKQIWNRCEIRLILLPLSLLMPRRNRKRKLML